MKKKTKEIISYCVFIIAVILGFLLIVVWSAFGLPPSYIRDDGGCIQIETKNILNAPSKYLHYRFEKCTRYGGAGVNISMYDLQTNKRVFSKTILVGFEQAGFLSHIECGIRGGWTGDDFEACDFVMTYDNWFGASAGFDYMTPKYYLKPPHYRDQK